VRLRGTRVGRVAIGGRHRVAYSYGGSRRRLAVMWLDGSHRRAFRVDSAPMARSPGGQRIPVSGRSAALGLMSPRSGTARALGRVLCGSIKAATGWTRPGERARARELLDRGRAAATDPDVRETITAVAEELSLVCERIDTALNAHDVDAFVACLTEDYDSVQPVHPDRAFRGREQARRNWTAIFASVEDFRSELVRTDVVAGTEWSEWRWHGTQADGSRLEMAGVIVFGVRDGLAAWARLYVEAVEQGGAGIDAAVRDMAGDD
jgi:ketosteroid isomerase-like protein